MKVLLSAYACEPGRGSEEGFGWNWSTHLAGEGNELWVLTRPHAREAIEEALRATPLAGLHFVYVDIPERYRPVMKGLIGVYLHYFVWQRAALRTATTLAATINFDVVHHVTWGSLIGGSHLWRLGKPFVFGPVGGGQVAPDGFEAYFPDRGRQEKLRTVITRHFLPRNGATRRMLKRTRLVLATNSDTLHMAERMGAQEARLFLDTGLPSDFFAAPAPLDRDAPLHILWVGRLLERKALKLSLEAVQKLTIPYRMTILGDGPQGVDVPGWLRELGLEGNVTWRGRVPWEEVRTAYREHHVFLFNSLRDSFGSQMLEAMANGLAIVTLNHQGARDFVPDAAGIKVPVTTADATSTALAGALEDLHRDPERLQSMRAAGYAFALSHEWTKKAAHMTAQYKSLLDETVGDVHPEFPAKNP